MSEINDIEVVDSMPEAAASEDVELTPEAETEEAPDVEREPEPEPEPEPKKHDAQSRIRQLANEKALLRQENQELQDLLRQRQPERGKPQVQVSAEKPKPDDYVGGVFNPDYIEALTDYKTEQAISKREHERTETQKIEAVKAKEAAFVQGNPGYQDALDAVVTSSLIDSQLIYEAISEDDNAPALVFYLGTNPVELERISKLSQAKKIMALGAISDGLTATAQAPAKVRAPQAKPLTPLSGNAPTLSLDERLNLAEKSGDADEYRRIRAEQRRAGGR
jgi:hypothetical protein